mmetsp:Transcript_3765/g.7204  ORF Transcript_3765/g.7204 Transcript_3765/m.7204 type:complete len:292 (-) Transcript_3765:1545-2420(-)
MSSTNSSTKTQTNGQNLCKRQDTHTGSAKTLYLRSCIKMINHTIAITSKIRSWSIVFEYWKWCLSFINQCLKLSLAPKELMRQKHANQSNHNPYNDSCNSRPCWFMAYSQHTRHTIQSSLDNSRVLLCLSLTFTFRFDIGVVINVCNHEQGSFIFMIMMLLLLLLLLPLMFTVIRLKPMMYPILTPQRQICIQNTHNRTKQTINHCFIVYITRKCLGQKRICKITSHILLGHQSIRNHRNNTRNDTRRQRFKILQSHSMRQLQHKQRPRHWKSKKSTNRRRSRYKIHHSCR